MTIITESLTPSSIDRMARETYPGMAHFAGTGPKAKSCGDCEYLQPRIGAVGYGCEKYRMMMGHQSSGEVPRQAKACKYFEQRKVTYGKPATYTGRRPGRPRSRY